MAPKLSPLVKSLIKQTKQVISDKNFSLALELSEDILSEDPDNLHGLVFSAYAYDGLENYAKSEEAYLKAAKIDPYSVIPWKGLLVLSEKKKSGPMHLKFTIGLIQCFEQTDEFMKGLSAFNQTKAFAKKHPWPNSKQEILELQIPGSPIFNFLQSRFPNPADTYEQLVALYEKDEKDAITKSNFKNTIQIGRPKNSKSLDVLYNIYKVSKLPNLYQQVINWTKDDDKRHEFEGKLLSYKYDLLMSSPLDCKKEIQQEVYDMASGMVHVNTSHVLAWKITIEWEDVIEIGDYDPTLLHKFIYKFPKENLAKSLIGYIRSGISPYDPLILQKNPFDETPSDKQSSPSSESTENNPESADMEANDFNVGFILESLVDGLSDDSLLSHRILCAFYLHIREYESVTDIGNKGLGLAKSLGKSFAVSFANTTNYFRTSVGTAYIFYQAPKNHNQALSLFEAVLKDNKDYTPAKIGKGLIFRETHKYHKAADLLKSALDEKPGDLDVSFEYYWCLVLLGKYKEGREGILEFLKEKKGEDSLSQDLKAQAWWRIGQSYWKKLETEEEKVLKGTFKKGPEKQESYFANLNESVFDSYAKSLKINPNFAPSYSSLGKFYAKKGDSVRATKCYYKAFELDGGDLDAAEELARDFANKSDWSLVSVVASRVMESERVRFMGNINSLVWPTRALGIAALNRQDYGAAVRYFQDSIRKNKNDVASWIGLGDAYLNSGSFDSAKKTFLRAQSIDPSNWVATFNYGLVLQKTREFNEASKVFKSLVESNPTESAPKMTLIETLFLAAKNEHFKQVYTQSVILATECIETAAQAILNENYPMTQDIWRVIGQCCEIFVSVSSSMELVPFDLLSKLAAYISECSKNEDISILSDIDEVTAETIKNSDTLSPIDRLSVYTIAFFKLSLQFSRNDKSSRAVGWYNLGLATLKIHLLTYDANASKNDKKYIYASMESLKRSIRIFNNSPEIWNAYGVACSFINSKVAQHSFIRALALDTHLSAPWINLAALYMRQEDLQLAEEAIQRALAVDPDFSSAWIAKGIIKYACGESVEARNTFQQAFEIGNGTEKLSKLYYALTVFELIQNKYKFISKGDTKAENKMELELESSVLSLKKFLKLVPNSTLATTLTGLIMERVGNYEEAIKSCTKLCEYYEQCYEKNEKQEDLIHFVRAKAHLARVFLGADDYEAAVEHSQFAIDVSSDLAEEDEVAAKTLKPSRLSAFLTSGLGYYFTQRYDESIECFKNALAESDEDQDVIVLLAQVLWAHGGAEERDVALEQLFGSIEKHGSASLNVALTLGAIGITHDSEIIEAAEEELKGFSQLELSIEDPKNKVPLMLSAMSKVQGQNPSLPWLHSAFYQPWNFDIWTRLDDDIAAIQAKARAGDAVSVQDLSQAYIGKRDFTSIQTSIFYAPWSADSWGAMATVI